MNNKTATRDMRMRKLKARLDEYKSAREAKRLRRCASGDPYWALWYHPQTEKFKRIVLLDILTFVLCQSGEVFLHMLFAMVVTYASILCTSVIDRDGASVLFSTGRMVCNILLLLETILPIMWSVSSLTVKFAPSFESVSVEIGAIISCVCAVWVVVRKARLQDSTTEDKLLAGCVTAIVCFYVFMSFKYRWITFFK